MGSIGQMRMSTLFPNAKSETIKWSFKVVSWRD